jgi:hypothetical protein
MARRPKPPSESDKPSDSHPDPANYPLGKTPALTRAELQTISEKTEQGQLPTKQEVGDVQGEARRALEKIVVMTDSTRPDARERVISATATVRATFSLDGLTEVGRAHREQQRKKARAPKTPHLNKAILKELNKDDLNATADGIWGALSNYNENDLKITVRGNRMTWEYFGKPERCGDLMFSSFESKVSRLRKQLRPK